MENISLLWWIYLGIVVGTVLGCVYTLVGGKLPSPPEY